MHSDQLNVFDFFVHCVEMCSKVEEPTLWVVVLTFVVLSMLLPSILKVQIMQYFLCGLQVKTSASCMHQLACIFATF